MDQRNAIAPGLTIGLDLSDRHAQICVMSAGGEIEERSRVALKPEVLRRRFGGGPPARIALEVGMHSPWVSRLLAECGHEVLVANPRKLRLIYENDHKSDEVDSEYLARVARLDPQLLYPVRHRGPQAQIDLAVLRGRDGLVRTRTLLINHVRGAVKGFGHRVHSCSAESFLKRAAELPEPLREVLGPVLQTIEVLTSQIRVYDARIAAMAPRYPETKTMRQVIGVGPLTSTAYTLVIDDPYRFRKSRTVGAYVGLRPRRDQSGAQDPQLRISKAGDKLLRRLLVSSAHYILGPFGPDTDLRRQGLALAARGGKNARKRAVIAVARKLAVLLHHLWVTGEVYEPLRNATLHAPEATVTQ